MLSITLDIEPIKTLYESTLVDGKNIPHQRKKDFNIWLADSINEFGILYVDFIQLSDAPFMSSKPLSSYDGYKELYDLINFVSKNHHLVGRDVSRCDGTLVHNILILDMEFLDE